MTPSNQLSKAKPQHDLGRRQFLGLLGAGATANVRFPKTVNAQETPIISMGNTYFDPIGLYVEPGTTVRDRSGFTFGDRLYWTNSAQGDPFR